MWYDNLDSGKKADYVKSFQKEYWNLSVKGEGNLSKDDLDKKWTDFCQKKYSDLSPNEKKYKDSLSKWIDFCKEFVTAYPKTRMFDYHFKPTDQYNSLDEFYRDFDASSYKLSLETKVNKARLDKLVNEGKIYLFEIRSQDSNHGKSKNHKDNLQTIYWQAVFSNLQNKPKLNGEAEIFYRKRVDNLKKKRDKKGKEIYENYRFRRNEWGKFLFHVPITLNLNLDNSDLETRLNQKFLQSGDTYYLGLDRGEKHLLYYCLINQKGEILKQGSLNLNFVDQDGQPKKIVTVKKKIGADDKMVDELIECANYNQLLEARAGNRDLARKQWQVIDDIKNLKLGYISQVVRKVVDLAVNLDNPRPTYIILEDLNTGFKRGRQKIEKQIYQKFELALAKKLNFLADKRKTDGFGSVTQAIQLTPYVANYADIENKKQVGVMLYARANYTSQTDPLTGWRKTIYIQNGSEDYIKTQILDGKFTDIRWENSDYVFVYEDQNVGKTWCMYSGQNGRSLDRFVGKRGDKDQWQTIKVDIHHVLDTIFSNFDKTKSLLEQMKEGVELNPFENMRPWEALRWVINLIQQIRNCGEQGDQIDQDFLQSPVRDETGRHFDSRNYLAQVPNQDVNTESIDYLPLPICGDANGAFNIARKGLIMHEHIKRCIKNIQSGKQGKNDLNLFISEEEWDLWLNDRTCWESRLDVFSSQKALESYRKKK
jgi:CRISPR-associated protein Cpf1